MRQDNGSLLNRIDQGSFSYEEFGDAAADSEVWPMFEALLRDERVVGNHDAHRRHVQAVGAPRAVAAPAKKLDPWSAEISGVAQAPDFDDAAGSLFDAYANGSRVEVPRSPAKSSVKTLLDRLARPE